MAKIEIREIDTDRVVSVIDCDEDGYFNAKIENASLNLRLNREKYYTEIVE